MKTKKPFQIGEKNASDWISRAAEAFRVSHPEEAKDALWLIIPGNTLSHKDPRKNVHSLHNPTPNAGFQQAQGSLALCKRETILLFETLRAHGCSISRIK